MPGALLRLQLHDRQMTWLFPSDPGDVAPRTRGLWNRCDLVGKVKVYTHPRCEQLWQALNASRPELKVVESPGDVMSLVHDQGGVLADWPSTFREDVCHKKATLQTHVSLCHGATLWDGTS